MSDDLFNGDDSESGGPVLPFDEKRPFTERDALAGMLDIAIQTAEEFLEDPNPLDAKLLRMAIKMATREAPEPVEELELPRFPEWNILVSFAEGREVPVDRIIDACERILSVVSS